MTHSILSDGMCFFDALCRRKQDEEPIFPTRYDIIYSENRSTIVKDDIEKKHLLSPKKMLSLSTKGGWE